MEAVGFQINLELQNEELTAIRQTRNAATICLGKSKQINIKSKFHQNVPQMKISIQCDSGTSDWSFSQSLKLMLVVHEWNYHSSAAWKTQQCMNW